MAEIMVVAMLLAVMGSFTVMSARNMFPRMRVDRASSRMAFQLQLARSEAIANNQSVWVWLDPASHELRIWNDKNRDGVEDPDEITTVVIAPVGEVKIDTSWETGIFNAYGQFISVPGQRAIRTQTTTFSAPGGGHATALTLRGSGAITKR